MDLSLKDKTAFVCGSSQGIGKAIAWELAKLGATVVLVARNEEKLVAVRDELPDDAGQIHHYVVADFNNPDEVHTAVKKFVEDHGEAHVLINNTGGPPGGPIFDADPEEFRKSIERHLICNHLLTQLLVPYMQQTVFGRIINIISTSVKEPIPGLGVSNTTRGAVASWAKSMSGELGKYGITVNNVLPGFTDTERLQTLIKAKSERTGQSVEDLEGGMKREVPVKRFATPEEVAAAAAFLATPAASYINGINVPVDGGRTHSL